MLRFISILVALIVLAACTSQGTLPAGYTTARQTIDSTMISFEHPERAVLLKEYELVVMLTDATGRPINNASVFLDLTMPAHPMGTNQPLADPLGGGRYRIRAAYTMDGEWIVKIHATISGREYVATFNQTVVAT